MRRALLRARHNTQCTSLWYNILWQLISRMGNRWIKPRWRVHSRNASQALIKMSIYMHSCLQIREYHSSTRHNNASRSNLEYSKFIEVPLFLFLFWRSFENWTSRDIILRLFSLLYLMSDLARERIHFRADSIKCSLYTSDRILNWRSPVCDEGKGTGKKKKDTKEVRANEENGRESHKRVGERKKGEENGK